MKTVFSYGVEEICDLKNGNEFKNNGQCLKLFLKSVLKNEMAMGLFDPMYR